VHHIFNHLAYFDELLKLKTHQKLTS